MHRLAGVGLEQAAARQASRVRRRRSTIRRSPDEVDRLTGRRPATIEAAWTKTLRKGVVGHDVRREVPGKVGAAREPALALVEVEGEAAEPRDRLGRASPVEVIEDKAAAGGQAVPFRAVLELIVVVAARAGGERQDFRDQVEIDRREERVLLVAALQVLAERVVHVLAKTGIARPDSWEWPDGRQAVRAAGQSHAQVRRAALRNGEIVEVHVVVDDELLPIRSQQRA